MAHNIVLKYWKRKTQILEQFARVGSMNKLAYLDNISRNVEALRKARGFSQAMLARKAGLSQKAISNLENAQNLSISPTIHTVTSVADALGVSVFLLFSSLDAAHLVSSGPPEPQKITRMIDNYISLPPDGRNMVDRVMELETRYG